MTTTTCDKCNGNGQVQCPACGGKGGKKPDNLKFSWEPCACCNGKGEIVCSKCKGKGIQEQ